MSTPVTRLIYISKNCIQGDDETVRDAINNILTSARPANESAGITGTLMFNHGCFAQILEGERARIEETFERIQYDERHCNIVILSFETVHTRYFSSWSMGYLGADQKISDMFDSISNTSEIAAFDSRTQHIFTLLREKLIEAENEKSRESPQAG